MTTFYSHRDSSGRGSTRYLLANDWGLTEMDNPGAADIIVWNGGEDISPSIYGERPIPYSGPAEPSKRDAIETAMFEKYKDSGKLLFGICRGSQLLNCLNGGKLWQDVDNHGRDHDMLDLQTGEVVKITSTHHQMMIPNEVNGRVIGVASRSRHKAEFQRLTNCEPSLDLTKGEDIEVVWYPGTNTLCMQGHPEYVPGSRYAAYTWELINRFWKKAA